LNGYQVHPDDPKIVSISYWLLSLRWGKCSSFIRFLIFLALTQVLSTYLSECSACSEGKRLLAPRPHQFKKSSKVFREKEEIFATKENTSKIMAV